MLVDFMIIGAQKCGTTSLAQQIASHSAICFCRDKEPGYFSQTKDWQAALDTYHALYTPSAGQLCGEASTMYTFFPESLHTPQNLYEYNPDLKLIYIMRDPVERIVSNYSHELVRGNIQTSPEATVLADPGYVNRSRYAVQLRPYLARFSPEQILLLVFEEYIANPTVILEKIIDFLGITSGSFEEAEMTEANKSTGSWTLKNDYMRQMVMTNTFQRLRPMIPVAARQSVKRLFSNRLDEKPYFSPALRSALRQLLADDIVAVEQFLGRPVDAWAHQCRAELERT